VVFIGFASFDEVLVKMIGVGLATAVIIDATIIRMVLARSPTPSPADVSVDRDVHGTFATLRPSPIPTPES
jgi:RND superfamily putative drug exporter